MNAELLKQARAAKNPEELAELAKANNLSIGDPAKAFELLKHHSELSDDELSNIIGGFGEQQPSRTVVIVGGGPTPPSG